MSKKKSQKISKKKSNKYSKKIKYIYNQIKVKKYSKKKKRSNKCQINIQLKVK